MGRRKLIVLSLCILMLILPTLSTAAVNVGDPAPDFSLTDLSGQTVSLSSFKGKVVLVNLWGTFCPPCIAEMPSLNRLYLSRKGGGLVVLAVSVDESERPVRSLVEANKIAFPVMMDKHMDVSRGKYLVYALPATFLVDKRGIIVEKLFGEVKWDSEEMQQKIAGLLKEK